jgi:hypothetical protein
VYQGHKISDEPSLKIRLGYLDNIVKEINNINFSSIYNKMFATKEELESNAISFISEYFQLLNKQLEDTNFLLMNKIFFIPSGTNNYEIFLYSTLITKYYGLVDCPYERDGLIFTPLNQKYTNNKSFTNFNIFKWKPPELNTIDFYIEFEKNVESGQDLFVYNYTEDENIK